MNNWITSEYSVADTFVNMHLQPGHTEFTCAPQIQKFALFYPCSLDHVLLEEVKQILNNHVFYLPT